MPSQSDLRYTFEPLVGNAEFEVVSFEHKEAISTPFTLELELVSFEPNIDFGQLLDKPILFTIWDGKGPVRYVHGLVSRFSQGESGFYRTYYHALVEPTLARAGLRSNWRIFQQKTVPQILELMLKRQGIDQYELRASLDHQVREFCVQAGETDLDFIARLAAEEGFVYRFEHSEKLHKLIITDQLLSLGLISHGALKTDKDDERFVEGEDVIDPNTVLYQANSGGDQARPCLRRLRYSEQVRTSRQVQRDYTFTHPAYRQEHRASGPFLEHQSTDYERFDYPGRYKRDAVGKPFTENRITALLHDVRIVDVQGDDVRLQPGLSFTLTGHPRDDLNAHWRVNSGKVGGGKNDLIAGDYEVEAGNTIRLKCSKTLIEMHANGTLNITCEAFNLTGQHSGQINTPAAKLDLNPEGGQAGATANGRASGGLKADVDGHFE
ncbi:type VI secretion system VgrG family protein [Pseudomonas fulva]